MKLIDSARPWYKGNTHAHTTRSDGLLAPEEVARLYQRAGYDFLAITDHWNAGPTEHLGDMLLLTGAEYDFSFPNQVLHVVGVFPDQASARGLHMGMDHRKWIDRINRAGGVAIAAHPSWSLNMPEFLFNLSGVCAAEVYNSVSGEPWNAARADSTAILDLVATAGRCFPQVAADDSHYYEGEQCRAFTMLQADALTPEGVIAALRRGSFYASQGPRFLDVELTDRELIVRTTPVCRCTFPSNLVWVEGRCRSGADMTENVYRIQSGDTFLRCEITDDQGRRAWLSPIKL